MIPVFRLTILKETALSPTFGRQDGKETMSKHTAVTIDGNEAAAFVAYKTNEIIAIYPITPSTPMGELSDAWAAAGERNIWGEVPLVQEMQSEGGVAGAAHGALQTGSLATTFTASQGLLLMIPNMYKIAGELTATVFHIAARSLAAQGLSIFGDHSDVMAARATGWGILFSASVQESMDLALVAHAATLEARLPFMHAFDGFRTSHEVAKIEKLSDKHIRAMIKDELVEAHRKRALTPENPVIRGTAQNPDVYFQGRESVNDVYDRTPAIVQAEMDHLAQLTGRSYHLFDYAGAPDAERVIVVMGSGAETVGETVDALTAQGEKVGVVTVRLFRPFSVAHLVAAFPSTVKKIAVLDRTKEPGSAGEPLYQDVLTGIAEALGSGSAPFTAMPRIIGGRYGLSSKEFTPAMVKAVFDNLAAAEPKNHFTVGINDDVTHTSLDYDTSFTTENDDTVKAVFWGLGSDGTVGANKNSIKIIGEETDKYAQGYFVYDSKKSGSVTISHLRFGSQPIHRPYLIRSANFVGVHQFGFLEKYPVLELAAAGATILLNSPYGPDEVWDAIPVWSRRQILDKKLKLYVLDATAVARDNDLGGRINTTMQTAFFALSGVLPREEAIEHIKKSIEKSYKRRGHSVVERNWAAVDSALSHLFEVNYPSDLSATGQSGDLPLSFVSDEAPDFVKNVIAEIIAGRGDDLPVSAIPFDGTWPTATSRWEKRNIGLEIPIWEPDLCIECGKCMLVCPHAVIRAKTYPPSMLDNAPAGFKSTDAKWKELDGHRYTIQVSTEDCTGCTLCVDVCPAKDKSNVGRKALNMAAQGADLTESRKEWEFFLNIPDAPRDGKMNYNSIKNVQLLRPLFEFSGACAGCGETPYLKLLSQLFGDRAIIANATGCSSIYGGNLPTTPWAKNAAGRGPAWANSLFEDNAEFGLGMRMTINHQTAYARRLVNDLRNRIGPDLADSLLSPPSHDDAWIAKQREAIARLREALAGASDPPAKDLMTIADVLVPRSIWIVGGDGWAYDIGYGGLDHVLASGDNVNVLVLDTEVYSNTGGQASKSTPRGAVAKFAAGGKPRAKKDLGRLAMSYGNVYVGQVALGAKDQHVIKTFLDAQSYDGPSLIIAYSHCIAHGIDMANGLKQQKMAVESGYWPLFRYDPRVAENGDNPFALDSAKPKLPLRDYIYTEARYRMLQQMHPKDAATLLEFAQDDVNARYSYYENLAAQPGKPKPSPIAVAETTEKPPTEKATAPPVKASVSNGHGG
jgi:pyruvate-ferredoxin/flavodoxin oxidoreductase